MRASLAAAALAFAVLVAGIRWGAMIAGGADSYGYVSQAGLWPQGLPIVEQDLVRESPWPDAAETWAPLGYRPSPHRRGAMVPIYPPGLPLAMAAFQAIGGYCALFLVVPLCGALTVWLTFALGRRLFSDDSVALWGALLVAASPVFLYQLMNAMSDVPATAFCTLALWLAVAGRPLGSGFAVAMAIAIRPNLAPLAGVIGAWLVSARAGALRFAIPAALAIVAIGWLNATLYESPFVSGYGTAGDLYAIRHFAANVRQFGVWIADVETPVVAASALYLIAPTWFQSPSVRSGRALIAAWAATVLLSYLFYQPFDMWWYLRYLLPMWPVMMLTTAAVLIAIAKRSGVPFAAIAIAILLAAHGLYIAVERDAFSLVRGERRYLDVSRFVAAHTEPNAVMVSVQHSGSLRLYADRLTLRYTVLDPLWLDRAVAYLHSIGRHPYFVLDGGEVDAFRRRFAASNRSGRLDWQPIARLGEIVSIYDPIARNTTAPLAIAQTRGARGWWACDAPRSWPPRTSSFAGHSACVSEPLVALNPLEPQWPSPH
jgi:Dolichyl-phosphate-mannose-protein mannosyltransferase